MQACSCMLCRHCSVHVHPFCCVWQHGKVSMLFITALGGKQISCSHCQVAVQLSQACSVLLQAAGYFGIWTSLVAWYIAFAELLNETWFRGRVGSLHLRHLLMAALAHMCWATQVPLYLSDAHLKYNDRAQVHLMALFSGQVRPGPMCVLTTCNQVCTHNYMAFVTYYA